MKVYWYYSDEEKLYPYRLSMDDLDRVINEYPDDIFMVEWGDNE